uniref:G protein-coupled receptor n=1 Tax=Ascaris lumbricoides TaxID=6252 RepID=A0A9J2PYN0_ASCLU
MLLPPQWIHIALEPFLYIAIIIALIRLVKRRQSNETCQQQQINFVLFEGDRFCDHSSNRKSSDANMLNIAVGIFYVSYSSAGIFLHVAEIIACHRISEQYGGFRFIMHSSIAEALLLFQLGTWGGIVVLCRNEIISPKHRVIANIFMNFTW